MRPVMHRLLVATLLAMLGAARNTCVAPIDMPPPGTFSTITGLPHFRLS